jgi:hypothetical protein
MQIDDVSKVFCMFKTTMNNHFFLMSSLFIKYAPVIFKIEKDLNIDDYKRKST